MGMVFDGFPDMERAYAFVGVVKDRFGLDGFAFSEDDAPDIAGVQVSHYFMPVACIDASNQEWEDIYGVPIDTSLPRDELEEICQQNYLIVHAIIHLAIKFGGVPQLHPN